MLIKKEVMEQELKEQMRGGNGTVNITHICNQDARPKNCRLIAHVVLEKGASIGFHEHLEETEIYYFLKGQGKVNDDGLMVDVQAGDAIATGHKKGHSVENTGEEPLEFVAVIILEN